MSYSFTVVASTKDDAKQKIRDEMSKVAAAQAAHVIDQAQAIAAGTAFVDLLGDVAEGHEIIVLMHGSVGWHHIPGKDVPDSLLSAGVGVSASIRKVATNG